MRRCFNVVNFVNTPFKIGDAEPRPINASVIKEIDDDPDGVTLISGSNTEPKEKKVKDKEIDLPSRFFYNYPDFERQTRKQMQKLKDLISEIKSNIHEGEDMM